MEQFLTILTLVMAFILGSVLGIVTTNIKMKYPIVLGWPGVFYVVWGPNMFTLLVVLIFVTLALAQSSFDLASATVLIAMGAISSPRLFDLAKAQFAKRGTERR